MHSNAKKSLPVVLKKGTTFRYQHVNRADTNSLSPPRRTANRLGKIHRIISVVI